MISIPAKIKEKIGDQKYHTDTVGMSDSVVLMFDHMVLKIEKENEESDNEYQMMQWLYKKLPVPEVLCFEKQNGRNYLLMSKLDGEMTCTERVLNNLEQLTSILVDGLKLFWDVGISDCPSCYNLDKKLKIAEYNVTHHLVKIENAEQGTFGNDGFKNPEQLLEWLVQNRPEEELVLSHGDYCLPNIITYNGKVSGFLDLGKTGIADKWQDIALCCRSFIHNYEGRYGGKPIYGAKPDLIFEKLGIAPDWEKIKYYVLLDELF